MAQDGTRGYKPIADYGAIGNLCTVALVARDGSIDWCCLPQFDSASVFAAILDARRGGYFRIAPAAAGRAERRYLEDTNVLETRFPAQGASLTLTDFMPLWGNIKGRQGSHSPSEIHRVLHCEGGDVDVEIEWAPRFDYARTPTRIHRAEGEWIAEGGDERLVLGGVTGGEVSDDGFGPVLRACLHLGAGERAAVVMRRGMPGLGTSVEDSTRLLERTAETWRGWVHRDDDGTRHAWAGGLLPQVVRSELALKLLIHADTGAMAAAPTTSLPETIGGVRNWDYRFTWIRDASLTGQALMSLGHAREATEFLLWVERVSEACAARDSAIQIMYGLRGELELPEEELSHLEGYRGSQPVRIGNAAHSQLQLDIYGELLDSAYELARRGVDLDESLREFLTAVADRAAGAWHRTDSGIWEVRGEPRHFVYSKLMAWVALDRASHLADRFGLRGDAGRWRQERDRLREDVLRHGYNPEVGAFVQSYGSTELDAANLLIPLHELLPFDDPRVQGTIDRTLEQLTENGMVYRYIADDKLPGKEGTFGLCTYWLVDALALSGRLDEAWEIFEGMTSRGNDLGLFSEQIDATSGEFLGNFPQAFTHVGLINSALYLGYAEGRPVPEPALIGTPEHRREVGHPIRSG
ncbi:glycoside hydrolase family 15 protein [soil metagenome]